MNAFVSRLLLLPAALGLAVATGCMHPPYRDSARVGPFFTPSNHVGDAQLPAGLRRVVLLPVSGGSAIPPESSAVLDPVFAAALQRQNRFEVIALSREDCRRWFQQDEFSSIAPLPRDLMTRLRREFAADAVLFVDLTAFQAYRPLALGVRAKLATVNEVRLIWTFDTIFSADNPAVVNSARRHFLDSDPGDVPADLTRAVLQSPSRFADYVATAMFRTLPPVVGAVVAETSSPAGRGR